MLPTLLILLAELPLITVDRDDFPIDRSCRIRIAADTIADANNDGVIHVVASDITIEFEPGSTLLGGATLAADQFRGCGIRIDGRRGVTLRAARVHGYHCGIWATRADGLTLADCDASRNRRDHLKSTPLAEDPADWLWPHDNDAGEWRTRYGAGLCVETARDITIQRCRANHGQNGLILDRVRNARVFDCDFSYNSGWGLALWRTDNSTISRNTLNFCIRGYSDGVYNRGQDSAGILMFEQCCGNTIERNSATHCGDGLFAFAGRESLGETGSHPPDWYKGRGCNDNLIARNDFSYAAAHGLELTFSFNNRILENRLIGNCICGIWAGYSQDTLIAGNEIACNGDRGYGAERGGVNIEHGRRNLIIDNRFFGNACGIHLWWDADEEIAKRPWAKANGVTSDGNVIAGNHFENSPLALHLRGRQHARIPANTFRNVTREADADDDADVDRSAWTPPDWRKDLAASGEMTPQAAQSQATTCDLSPRAKMVVTDWGPWNHRDVVAQVFPEPGSRTLVRVLGTTSEPSVEVIKGRIEFWAARKLDDHVLVEIVSPPGCSAATLRITADRASLEIPIQRFVADWSATFFAWPPSADPRENLGAWRSLAAAAGAAHTTIPGALLLPFGNDGPSQLAPPLALAEARLPANRFGCVAETRVLLEAGRWRVRTRSDDGIRVMVDGRSVIENWTWHVPTVDTGEFELMDAKEVQIIVEYFEIDGYATLEFDLAPVRAAN